MARKKKAAGEGTGHRALQDALASKKEEPQKKERKSWRNADKDPDQALLLMEWHEKVLEAYSAGDGETVALLQLHHAVPSSYPDNTTGKPLGWDQLKKLGRNIMSRMVESLASRLMKPAAVQVATVGGDNKQDMAARAANKAVKGINSDNNSLQKETRMVKDCLLTHRGTGYAVWLPDANENMVLRRLDPRETWVSGDGKEATTKMYWPRREALAVLPKLIEKDDELREQVIAAITNVDEEHPQSIEGVDQEGEICLEDTIAVYMGWQDAAGDRKAWWVIQIDGKTAISREFPLPIHPVWWIQGTAGYREGTSKPAGREVAPSSYWVNQLQQTLWKQLQGAKTKVLHQQGTTVTSPDDTNFQKIEYTGRTAPTIVPLDTVSEAVERNIEKIITDALADIGLNEETTVGDIPSGVTSGIGIVKAQGELSIRFSEFSHNINIGRLRSVRIVCYWLSHLKKKGIKVRGENTADLESIDWPNLDMKENSWTVIVQTAGALPDQIAGKHQVLGDFQDRGLIDEVDAASFYDNPDLKAALDEKTAPRRLIKLQISMCLDVREGKKPKIFGPDETQDPKEGTRLTGIYFQKARLEGGEKKYGREAMWALLRLHLLYKQRVSMPATPASISASTDPLAGGGTNPAQAGAAAPVGAGALTDVGAQAAAATTGATGAI